jgi:hypothetical protein
MKNGEPETLFQYILSAMYSSSSLPMALRFAVSISFA